MDIKNIEIRKKYRVIKPINPVDWDDSLKSWIGKVVTVTRIRRELDPPEIIVKENEMNFFCQELEPIVGDWDE